jgi:tetratricopeptide (TPR) repeat protein
MNLNRRRSLFYERRRSNLYRMFAWALIILAGIWVTFGVRTGRVTPLFLPTPTATRMAQSYALEGEAFFTAGKLEASIQAYQDALRIDPSNAEIQAKLARIQTYSSSVLTTDAERKQRLAEALQSADQAVALAPDDSNAHAIRSFVLDWNASAATTDAERQSLLLEADREATRALQLDPNNVLAQAFYAEILVDEQKWSQAEQVIVVAAERGPDLMDVHRVYGYILESTLRYRQAIEEYQKAIEINPNLTFLYISVGQNYRQLAFKSEIPSQSDELYALALEYFAKAADLNKQLDIKDPLPYIAIAKTYSRKGDYFAAALNIKRAVEFDTSNPDLYGQMGAIYYQARNYESSIYALQCAVEGCTPDESCLARYDVVCDETQGYIGVSVTGLELSPGSRDYYMYYGSALALFAPRYPEYCTKVVSIMDRLQAEYGSDPIVSQNVSKNLAVCAGVARQQAQTPTPVPTPTALPTPRP